MAEERNIPEITEVADLTCKLIRIKGISKKSGKEYTMYKLEVDAEEFGTVDLLLNTFSDRAGIVLSMLDHN